MLSLFRQKAAEFSRRSYRYLATATVGAAQSQPPPPLPEASSVIPPVYLSMSSLLPTAGNLTGPTSLEGSNSNDLASQKVAVLDPYVFDQPIRRDILHLCVIHHRDSLRQGSANTKTRYETRGSNRKLRPQKGTGKARLGDRGSPMLRGGGVAFGPKPRDFSTKLPRKVIHLGMRVALSIKVKEQNFGVVESLNWPGLKTKGMARRIDELGWRKTLFITGQDKVPEGLARSASNVPRVEAITAKELNIYDAVRWQRLVLDLEAVEYFERTLGRNAEALPATTPIAM